MRRRDFIKVVAGSATAWPFMARAQERIRLVGLLNILAEDDPESRLRIATFKKSLQELCWTDGSIRIEARWAGGDVERLRKHAKELVALGPDVILTSGSITVRPLQQGLVRYRSCSCRLLIRWGPDTSKACRARAATLPGSPNSNTA